MKRTIRSTPPSATDDLLQANGWSQSIDSYSKCDSLIIFQIIIIDVSTVVSLISCQHGDKRSQLRNPDLDFPAQADWSRLRVEILHLTCKICESYLESEPISKKQKCGHLGTNTDATKRNTAASRVLLIDGFLYPPPSQGRSATRAKTR